MSTYNGCRIPSFSCADYTLQWHEQGESVVAERIFPNGVADHERYPVEIPQSPPSRALALSLRKVIKSLLREGYIPVIADKRITWRFPENTQRIDDLSRQVFSSSLNASSSFPFATPEISPMPSMFNTSITNNYNSTFQDKVYVGQNFNITGDQVNIGNLTLQASSFSLSFTEGIFNLPLPPQHFTGREDQLQQLHTLCQNNKRVMVSGLGGVGKTATVLQYAAEHKTEYCFIHFITGETFDRVTEGLLHLANEQSIPSGTPRERLEMLKTRLNRFKKPFLLIFDGIDSLPCLEQLVPLLPNQGQCLLMTSRLAQRGEDIGFVRLELSPFAEEEAVAYLIKASGDADSKQAAVLAKELGYLPLALKHAAAYIKNNRDTLAGYLFLFQKHGVKLQEGKYLHLSLQEKTILTTWEISLKAIGQECTSAIKLAHFLSCLAHAPIPKGFLHHWFHQCVDESELEFTRALGCLKSYSFLEDTKDICGIHVLVQKVIRFSLAPSLRKRYLQDALVHLALYSPLSPHTSQGRALLTLFVPHFLEILHHWREKTLSHKERSDLLRLSKAIWNFNYWGGQYREALEAAEMSLRIVGAGYEEQSLAIADTYNDMGCSLQALGKYEEALDYHRQALEMMKSFLAPNHPDVASLLNNVGLIYGTLGKYAEALEYQKEAFAMAQKCLGPKHSGMATFLNNMGLTYGQLGEHREALKCHSQALEMRQELLDGKHPDIIVSLNNIGLAHKELGEYAQALQYAMKALEISKELLGVHHPLIASSLNSLGTVYAALGNQEEALRYKTQALEMRQELLGDKHPSVAASLSNVGSTWEALGEYRTALKYHKEALEMRRELLGSAHPETAQSLNNVGAAYAELGKYEKALRYHKKALKWTQELLGTRHPDVAKCLNNVGRTYEDLGQYEKALKYQQEALEMRKELLGPQHLDIAISLNNVGLTWGELGQHDKALSYYEEALQMKQNLLGYKHPGIATILGNIGPSYEKLGQRDKALKYQQEALAIRQKLLGAKHPDVAMSLNNVGLIYGELKEYDKALKYHKEALEMQQELLGPQHPNVAISLSNVSYWYAQLGKMDCTLRYYKAALLLVKTGNMRNRKFELVKMQKNLGALIEKCVSQAEELKEKGSLTTRFNLYEEALGGLLELHDARFPVLSDDFLALEIVQKLPLFELCGKYPSLAAVR